MKVKTNLRAGSGGSTVGTSTSTSASNSAQNQNGKGTHQAALAMYVNRCAGI